MKRFGVAVVSAAGLAGMMLRGGAVFGDSIYAPWTNGPPTDPNFFEIGVWYQTPSTSNINGYKAMGVNTIIYPVDMTQAQLNAINTAGMYTIIPQDSFGLANVNNKAIISWFNNYDEPDNAQSNGSGGFTDPILPQVLINDYNVIKAADPTRPVELGLGQGVAWDNWNGRGSRTSHPQDYAASTTFTWTNGTVYHQGYLAGSDIGSYDFYPTNATNSQVAGKINLVGFGVDRLRSWSAPEHPVWNDIETTNISNTDSSPGPTGAQVKAEVWLSLVHGSMGIIYFAHTITPFKENALLQDPVMNPAVTAIDAQVKSLAPELNSPTLDSGTITTGTASSVHVDFMTKALAGNEYLFAVADQNSNGTAFFRDPAMAGVSATVMVLGESRQLNMVNGGFMDPFGNNGVHLYEILNETGFTPALAAPVPECGTLGILALGLMGLGRRSARPKTMAKK